MGLAYAEVVLLAEISRRRNEATKANMTIQSRGRGGDLRGREERDAESQSRSIL
jgi:hypothetical protein